MTKEAPLEPRTAGDERSNVVLKKWGFSGSVVVLNDKASWSLVAQRELPGAFEAAPTTQDRYPGYLPDLRYVGVVPM